MTPELSILIPAIRTPLWPGVVSTIAQSCRAHTYEIVFVGPFALPASLQGFDNIRHIKSYACPSVCGQIGLLACQGRLIYHTVDDAFFIPSAIDQAILHQRICRRQDVVNMRYTEFDDYAGKTFTLDYWRAHFHGPLQLPGIPPDYRLALHFLIDREYFLELGGFDCRYEYQNFDLHDLMFRIQALGGKIYDSPTDVTNCNHFPGRSVDHGPIVDAYAEDLARFHAIYSQPDALRRIPLKIPLHNWKEQPEIWERRFSRKLYDSYAEMLSDQGSGNG